MCDNQRPCYSAVYIAYAVEIASGGQFAAIKDNLVFTNSHTHRARVYALAENIEYLEVEFSRNQ